MDEAGGTFRRKCYLSIVVMNRFKGENQLNHHSGNKTPDEAFY